MTSYEEINRVAEELSRMALNGAAQLIYRLARERNEAWCEGRDAAAEASEKLHDPRALKSPYEEEK